MIRYTLVCDRGHEFEGWFRSSADFDDQSRRGLLACACGSHQVEKGLMAPSVAATPEPEPAMPVLKPNPKDVAMREMLKQMRAAVMAKTEDVGDRFPEEARKIHYEENGERAIRGRATPDEAKALIEEGITVAPLPVLPDDHN